MIVFQVSKKQASKIKARSSRPCTNCSLYRCAYDVHSCDAQQHRAGQIISPLTLQTITIAQTLSVVTVVLCTHCHRHYHMKQSVGQSAAVSDSLWEQVQQVLSGQWSLSQWWTDHMTCRMSPALVEVMWSIDSQSGSNNLTKHHLTCYTPNVILSVSK